MISVIIPTLDEAAQLTATFAALQRQAVSHEVIVVDAESADGTALIAACNGARVLQSPRRQRAAQMNAGARVATGDCLLFLHADTRLPQPALARIGEALQQPAVLGGGFARRYESTSHLLRLTCALAEMRTRCCGWFLGDQAMFVRRPVFEQLGGFREWDAFEDLDFARRLARAGRVVTLRPPVFSAGRRFASRGVARTTWCDLLLTARYLLAGQPNDANPPPCPACTVNAP